MRLRVWRSWSSSAMILVTLVPVVLSLVPVLLSLVPVVPAEPALFFHGHVFENAPLGSRVNGLSVPLERLRGGCSGAGFQLLGDGAERFRVFLHHRRAQVLLKTRAVLDREELAQYALSLRCSDRAVRMVASIQVDVLDTNDHQPTFPGSQLRLRLDDATALRSAVISLSARDGDSGQNAELIYFVLPGNGTFYAVPKTGQILLVDSILGLQEPVRFQLFARDRGWPPRTSRGVHVEVYPRQCSVPRNRDHPPAAPARRSRSVPEPEPDRTVLINVSEDAGIGSVVMNLNPVRFQSATFQLVEPEPESQNPAVSVSRDSGDLVIIRRLDRETEPLLEITVRVQDKRGPDWYPVRVDLTVTDVNDNVPEWSMVPVPYLAVVSPDAAAGSVVYRLQAEDGDQGNNGEVEYFLSDGGDGRFEVDRKSGLIRTTGLPLQKEREYLLTVVAADRLGARSVPAVVSVVAGARPPQFTNASYTVSIPENTPEGRTFLVTEARSFQQRALSYSLLINPSSLFSISADSGHISLTRSLDYETDQHRYLLLVRATEGLDSMSGAAEVRVVIVDENDCVPEFLQSIYSKDGVPETVTTATSLLQVSASDCDSEENAELTYYTLSHDFTVSPHGTVFPARPLDYERPNHLYEFVVMAVDKGAEPRTGTASVRIRMANVNDEEPQFSQHVYRTFVSEDAGPNTLVATVLAKDPDGDGITYIISAGNEEGNFIIDSQKGLIRLRSTPPPRLQGVEYVLNVTATDDNASGGAGPLSATAQVIVGVDDVNNNKPVFEMCQQYRESTSVLENQPAGTFVLQVHAVDADEGSNGKVTYGFMHKESTVPAFSIHPDTGVMVTARKFDRERQREYAVTVTATDQAVDPLIGICQLNILILDQNDNSPKFENIRYEYFLREDTMVGTSFLRVAAHDDDFGSNAAISYSLSEEEPEYLRVNPVTGWVYVHQPISQRSVLSRSIVATDGGNRSSSVQLSVTITNVKNQPPQWEQDSYRVVISENTVRDTPIVTVKATSPLGDPRVTYNLADGLVPETNMPVRFYLTPNREDSSASILVAEPLDYETTRYFVLRVRAQNVAAVPLAAFTTVYVNVTDVNDNVPFFTSSIYEASVTEGAETGTLVFQVSATDLDLGLNGKISYSLLEDRSGDHRFFRVDPDSGSIFTAAVFDRETKSSYLLEVESADGSESARPGKHGQPNSDTAYVRIFISDVNDNRPTFARPVYEVGVDEDADVGVAVLTVSAVDGDEGGNAKLRYQITSGNTGGVFDVEPEVGTIFIAQTLDYEHNKRYELHVLASDGKWEDYTTVTVNVVNKNDEAPVFTANEYYGSVTEELDGSPVFVLQVTAVDPDQDADPAALRYSLHGQGADGEFAIDEATGKIYAQRTLDREERAAWRFVVLATDEGGEGLTGFADVVINVWDINDNAPAFACAPVCRGAVPENSPAGTSVMEMSAADRDDAAVGRNAALSYRIVGGSDPAREGSAPAFMEMFAIHPVTGTITVAAPGLDREQVQSFLLVVEARDGGGMTGSGTASIQIQDVNDHTPTFSERFCEVRISESAEVNSEVLELWAEDGDSGQNAELTFSVVSGDQEQKFFMVSHKQEQRGTLRLKKRLDYERHSEQRFNLTLKVEDLDFSSLLHCVVEVDDYNDHAPVFLPHFLSLAPLPEDVAVGTVVAHLMASDLDSGQNSEFTYSLSADSDPEGQFSVDQSGVLTVVRPLDRERTPQHLLVVMATDHGTPALTGSATVQLPLLDVNDNGPAFEAAYAPVVFENVLGPQVVRLNHTSTLLCALDPDSPENGPPFRFSIPAEYRHGNDFYLQDHHNGSATLTAMRTFDRERQKEFPVPIVMSDSGRPAKTVTATLTVTIGDQNDHAHAAGEKKIFINSHRGRMPTTVLGKVYSPDPDDWDNKTYVLEGHAPSFFILNTRTGFLIIKENAPPGFYQLQVRVSDGLWPDVVSTVSVHVRELRELAVENSASLRLTDITAKGFLEPRGKQQRSRYELLVDFLSEMLSVPPEDVNVFSLTDAGEDALDVRFAVHSGASFLRSEKIHGYLAAHRQKLQSFLQVNVVQVRVDQCPGTDCSSSGGCSTVLTVRDTPTVVDCGSMSLVSVTVEPKAVCSCPGRDRSHLACAAYARNPCSNGGLCVDTQHGYRCQCPAQFEGPECQQNKRSFHGNGYAWFPPMMPCFESHVSLEFITDVPDGLLLYSGPLAQLQTWDYEDFMALELIDGTPTLKVNHGSGTLILQLPSNVNVADRRWHRLDVRSNSKEVRLTLDRCSGAAVMETEGLGTWLTTEDHTSCEATGVTPNTERHLNTTQVLQLGGVNEDIPYIYPQLQHKHFTGCVRNLVVDSKLYDLGSPADSGSSSGGCWATDSSCVGVQGSPSCGQRGRCQGEWGSFSCQCVPGFGGQQCELELPEYSLDGHSLVRYQLPDPLPARRTGIQVLLRTRKHSSTVLSLLSQGRNEYLRLEIFHGLLCVFFNLGDGDYNLTLPLYRVDDGEWHEVRLDRHDNELMLLVDGGGGQRETSGSRGRSREIVVDPGAVVLGNTFPSDINRSFQGCVRDVRLNGHFLPLEAGSAADGVSQLSVQGLSEGCSSDSCRRNHCRPPLTCVDLWREHECRCPPGHMIRVNGSGRSCVYTPCAMRPCLRGTCIAHTPTTFTCHCPDGYRGRHCHTPLGVYREDVGLSTSSLFAICICFMALLALLLGIFLYTRWRSYKGLKEGVYHVSAHHDGWEDVRENVLNYDEEGGGEEDQNAYDMVALQKSLQPSPAQSLQYCRSRALHRPAPPAGTPAPPHHHHHLLHQTPTSPPPASDPLSRTPSTTATLLPPSSSAGVRRDVPPTHLPAQGQARPPLLPRRSLSFSSQDLARYLCEIIRDADQHPDTGPFDSLQVFSTEGGGSPAGSLSSFSSAGLEVGAREETLADWGPQFETLRALYEHGESSHL